MRVNIVPNDKGNPPRRLAEVELQFESGEPLAGHKLIGFSIWERRGGNGRNVTFPARSYAINGERRSYALLRPTDADQQASTILRDRILEAFAEWEELNGAQTLCPCGCGSTQHHQAFATGDGL